MQDNLIWSGNAFFASAGDHMYETHNNTKGSNRPEKANKPEAQKSEKPNKPEVQKPEKPNKPEVQKPEKPNKPEAQKPEKPNKPEAQKPEKPNKPDGKPGLGDIMPLSDDDCGYKTGDQPACAPLAVGYVPWQRSVDPVYGSDDALTRGTLFPGLDLPFMDVANRDNPYAGTPLGDLMAISFVVHELTLYLDTHPKDKEAFSLQKKMMKLNNEAHARYTKRFGPVTTGDLLDCDTFTWTHGPWPWETPAPGTTRSGI